MLRLSFLDISVITLKCQPERIEDLKAQHECIGNPYNESPKHWIGINPATAPDELLKELTRNSYEIVRTKYTKVKNPTFVNNAGKITNNRAKMSTFAKGFNKI